MLRKAVLWTLVVGLVAVYSGQVAAQQDDAERENRRLDRAIEDLGLSGEQAQKFREAFEAQREKQQALQEGLNDSLREILEPEQMQRYEEMRDRGGRGAGGADNRGGSRRGGMFGGDMTEQTLNDMRERLGLTEEQEGKIREILDTAQNEARQSFEGARSGGGFDRSRIGEMITQSWNKVKDQVRGLLGEDQMAKFDEFVAEREKQMEEMRQRFERFAGGDRRGNDAEGGDRGGDRVAQAVAGLDLEAEEREVIEPMIRAVIEHEAEMRRLQRENGNAIDEALGGELTSEGVEATLQKVRDERKVQEAKLQELREELRSVLTLKQEARLVGRGILD